MDGNQKKIIIVIFCAILILIGAVFALTAFNITNDDIIVNETNNTNMNVNESVESEPSPQTSSENGNPSGEKVWSEQLQRYIYEEDLGGGSFRQYDENGNLIGSGGIPEDQVYLEDKYKDVYV